MLALYPLSEVIKLRILALMPLPSKRTLPVFPGGGDLTVVGQDTDQLLYFLVHEVNSAHLISVRSGQSSDDP